MCGFARLGHAPQTLRTGGKKAKKGKALRKQTGEGRPGNLSKKNFWKMIQTGLEKLWTFFFPKNYLRKLLKFFVPKNCCYFFLGHSILLSSVRLKLNLSENYPRKLSKPSKILPFLLFTTPNSHWQWIVRDGLFPPQQRIEPTVISIARCHSASWGSIDDPLEITITAL